MTRAQFAAAVRAALPPWFEITLHPPKDYGHAARADADGICIQIDYYLLDGWFAAARGMAEDPPFFQTPGDAVRWALADLADALESDLDRTRALLAVLPPDRL